MRLTHLVPTLPQPNGYGLTVISPVTPTDTETTVLSIKVQLVGPAARPGCLAASAITVVGTAIVNKLPPLSVMPMPAATCRRARSGASNQCIVPYRLLPPAIPLLGINKALQHIAVEEL
jgi:hypothetical protein